MTAQYLTKQTLKSIIEIASWAPSGENSQPWKFEIAANDTIVIHANDTRDVGIDDFLGRRSHIAHGALLENMRVAATGFGLSATTTALSDFDLRTQRYIVQFLPGESSGPSSLIKQIKQRATYRFPMKQVPLNLTQKTSLVRSTGEEYSLTFREAAHFPAITQLLWKSAQARLNSKSSFEVQRAIIEWDAQYSNDKIPEFSTGVGRITGQLMQWGMKSWRRYRFFNTFLGGALLAKRQLTHLPAMHCSAHVLIKPRIMPTRLNDWLHLGGAVQRMWLTATENGMVLQPEMGPVILRWYEQANQSFTEDKATRRRIKEVTDAFNESFSLKPDAPAGFLFRVGFAEKRELSRSLRKPPNLISTGLSSWPVGGLPSDQYR